MKKNLDISGGCFRGLAGKTFGVLGVVTMAGLVFGAWAYDKTCRKTAVTERNVEVINQLMNIGQCQYVLHQLGDAQVDAVRQRLSLGLARDIRELRSGLGSASEEQRAFAENICGRIAADEKAHPDYYLTASPEARHYENLAWEAVGKEALKPMAVASRPAGKAAMLGDAENN
jgi:hypothetical protein